MENIAINIQNVKKSFKVHNDKGNTLKERLIFFKSRNAHTRHEVLKGVSLEINKGDVVGLVGQNGCGKSTLLKLMTRIIYPDSGSITVKGKVSSLLELGAGFHPDMSGRENIYINASIFGLTRKEIDSKIDQIIEFSELIEFIDSPVRTYSSGMYMRLAFSVAINVEAEILLIDEILAVGDANFQAKCFNKMQELKVINYLKIDKDSKGLADTQIKSFIDNFIDKKVFSKIEFNPNCIYLTRHNETSIEHFTLFGLTPKNSREMIIYITALNYSKFTNNLYKENNNANNN